MKTASSGTLKKGKDFTPKERDAIIARAQRIGARKVAEEVGTSLQVVAAWLSHNKKQTQPMQSIIPGKNGLPAKRDDYHTYTNEERKLLVEKADEVGRVKIQNAYGLMNYTLRDWKRIVTRQAKTAEPQTIQPEEKQADVNTDIIPGEKGLPKKRTTPYTYTHEERRRLVAKAAEVGKAKIREAYNLRKNTLFDWEKTIKRQDRRATAQARADEKKVVEVKKPEGRQLKIVEPAVKDDHTATDTIVSIPAVIPGQNGLPAKRDNPHDYTSEERRLVVEKANEVGNSAVKAAYGFKHNYIIHDWRRVVERQAKKAVPTENLTEPKPAVQEPTQVIAPSVSIAPDVPAESPAHEPQVHETLLLQPTQLRKVSAG